MQCFKAVDLKLISMAYLVCSSTT